MNSKVLTALFDTRADAEQASRSLGEIGVIPDDLLFVDSGESPDRACLLHVEVDEPRVDRVCAILEQSRAIDLQSRESHHERMRVGKREVRDGGVQRRSHVVEQPVHEQADWVGGQRESQLRPRPAER